MLFALDRDGKTRTSRALWIPVIWFLIAASRNVSSWLQSLGLISSVSVSSNMYVDGSPLDRNIYLGLIILAIITLSQRRAELRRLLGENLWIVAFFLYAGISVAWSDFPDIAFKRWIKAIGDPLMIMVVLTDPDRLAAIKRLFTRVSFTLMPLSVLVIKYYPNIGRDYSNSWEWMYRGVASHKNSLGLLGLVCGLASLWRMVDAHRQRPPRWRRMFVAHAAALACITYLFIAANSKTSLATFLIAGGLLLATQAAGFFRRPAIVHLSVFGVPAVVCFALFFDSSGIALQALGRDSTLTGRTETWELVIGMAASQNTLLGSGFESFWLGSRLESLWNSRFEGLNQAHNGYIEVYLNLGWIGLVLLLGILFNGYRRILQAFRQDAAIAGLWLSIFLSTVLVNISEAQFKALTVIWPLLLLGIMACPRARSSPVPAAKHKPAVRSWGAARKPLPSGTLEGSRAASVPRAQPPRAASIRTRSARSSMSR